MKYLPLIPLILLAACQPEPPCDMKLAERILDDDAPVEKAWCPGPTPTLILPEENGCPDEIINPAVKMWTDKGVELRIARASDGKEYKQSIYFEVNTTKYKAWGNCHKEWLGNAIIEAVITVHECHVLLIAHEIGHAIGFDHSDDENNLMYPTQDGHMAGIPDTQIEALMITRASAK